MRGDLRVARCPRYCVRLRKELKLLSVQQNVDVGEGGEG
jgi:hypothetical protein